MPVITPKALSDFHSVDISSVTKVQSRWLREPSLHKDITVVLILEIEVGDPPIYTLSLYLIPYGGFNRFSSSR